MKKDDLRKTGKLKRKELSLQEVLEKSNKAADIFINSELYQKANVMMLYYPLGNETDTSYILKKALSDKKTVLYPITDINTNEITPIIVNSETRFEKGVYSVFEPTEKTVYNGEIDVILVPGIAFDKRGFRVGFGKGCYDRFLKMTDTVKIGFCYDFQIDDEIDNDSFDIKMDILVSESGMIVCE